jgi:hypothetical protein
MRARDLDSSAADFFAASNARFVGYAGDLPQDQFAMRHVLA